MKVLDPRLSFTIFRGDMNIIFNHVYVLLYVSVDILYCYVLKLILLRILNDLFAAV